MTAKKDGDFRQGVMVAATTDHLIASRYLKRAENLYAKQQGKRIEDVRPEVASKLTITPDALAFIRRERRKNVPSWLKDSIVCLFIEVAQAELRAIEHEIEVARQIGLSGSDGRLVKARARAKGLFHLLEEIASERIGADQP